MSPLTVASSHLSGGDFAVVGFFVALLFLVGYLAGREETGTNDFFLGGRRVPWWAACLSFVATEISALTIISVPATAYRENWQYAQLFIGSALSRVAIAFLFIPAFYRFDCTTIYEFLGVRFGQATQIAGSCFFFFTRLLGSAVRLLVACMAVKILFGWSLWGTLIFFTAVSIVYIAHGGVKAVVWTNVVQALTFLGGGLATIGFLHYTLPGGLPAILAFAATHGKTKIFDWGPGLFSGRFVDALFSDPHLIYVAIANGFVGSLAAFGTDHDLMQRLLTVETRRQSQRTMLLTIVGSFCVLVVFLTVGAGLFAYYAQHPGPLGMAAKLDEIYPHFVNQAMPEFLRGLMLAAIILASIDSPLGSLAASFVNDIYRPALRPGRSDRHYLLVSRAAVIVFGLLLALIAYGFSYFENMLWLAFKIGGVTFGSLLGVFLLGLLTERRADRANVAAMLLAALTNAALLWAAETGRIGLGWTWLILIGTSNTFLLAWLLGPLLDGGPGKPGTHDSFSSENESCV
ncbi:MAG: sodium/solute symporter, partial [Candidatus Wallbacteria bacterium]|nr:sodium/solute symporter [Candidatus Wallbacteria bacterium]